MKILIHFLDQLWADNLKGTTVRDPPDPRVFGPPGSRSISLRLRILPFSHKGVERTEIMKENFNTKFGSAPKCQDHQYWISP